jgi:hypothetical protein
MFLQTSWDVATVDATITQNTSFTDILIGFNAIKWSLFPCQIASYAIKLTRCTYRKSK